MTIRYNDYVINFGNFQLSKDLISDDELDEHIQGYFLMLAICGLYCK